MASQKKIGLHVSDACKTSMPDGKDWFEFRSFVRTYWQLLSEYRLLVSLNTAAILNEFADDLERSCGIEVPWDLEVYPNRRLLVNRLVASNREEIGRVLFFLDPRNLEYEMESLFTLREAIAEHGQKLNINLGTGLWAEREQRAYSGIEQTPFIGTDDAIAFVGQSSSLAIDRFAVKHLENVLLFPRLISMRHTWATIAEYLKAVDAVSYLVNEAYDRTEDIASSLVNSYLNYGKPAMEGKLCHVIACPGRSREQSLRQDIERFIHVCANPRMRINLMLNKETAEEWIRPFDYHRLIPRASA